MSSKNAVCHAVNATRSRANISHAWLGMTEHSLFTTQHYKFPNPDIFAMHRSSREESRLRRRSSNDPRRLWSSQMLHFQLLHDLSCKTTIIIYTMKLFCMTNSGRAKQADNLCQICYAKTRNAPPFTFPLLASQIHVKGENVTIENPIPVAKAVHATSPCSAATAKGPAYAVQKYRTRINALQISSA